MARYFFSYFLLFLCQLQLCSGQTADPRSWEVLVSIPPHKYFVERIAGDTVKVLVLIPPGANTHTFEPTAKQALSASEADIWFRIGEPIENQIMAALQSHNSRLKTIDLRKGIELITQQTIQPGNVGHYHFSGGEDLHFWLSPQQAQSQAKTIAKELMKQYPENTGQYQTALEEFLQDLKELDKEIAILLNPLANRTILVSHPAYAYFCRDYNLTQLSIEFEGKDPLPQQLTSILETARKLNVKRVFIQPQFQNKGAKLIAENLGAELIPLDPYSEDYFEMIREIGKRIAGK